jgi:hypothetical protein
MTEPSSPQGFSDGQSFQYDGKLDSVPDWVDKGWATYSAGPALAVPRGDPNKQPYNTVTARLGDWIFVNKKGDRYTVVRAEEVGDQPGSPTQLPTQEKPLPAKPVGTEYASLEDLDRLDILPFDEMNEEQQAQMRARGTAPKSDEEVAAEKDAARRGNEDAKVSRRRTTKSPADEDNGR